MLKRVHLAAAAWVVASLPASAGTPQTRAQLNTQINSQITANGQGAITGANLNSVLGNVAASFCLPDGTQCPAVVVNPKLSPFNAKCDGTDDAAAINAAAATLTAGSTFVIPGTCAFKSALTFPTVNNITINGGTLLYTGASTTLAAAVTIGSTAPGCIISGWNVQGLTLQSSTAMTAGDALLVGGACNSNFSKISVGGQFGTDNGNWYNGLHGVGGNNVRFSQSEFRGSHFGELVHGNRFSQPIDWYFDQTTVSKSGVGTVIGGGAGGFNWQSGDDVGNGQNLLIRQDDSFFTDTTSAPSASGSTITITSAAGLAAGDSVTDLTATGAIPAGTTIQSIASNVLTLTNAVTSVGSGDTIQFGVPNKQVLLGGLLAIDGTDTTLCIAGATACGVGVEILDIGNSNSPSTLVDHAWHAFAQNQCVLVDATALYWTASFDGPKFGTCGSGGALSTGAFDNESASASAFFHLQFNGTYFNQNNGQDIYNVSSAQPILLLSSAFDSSPPKITGMWTGSAIAANGAIFTHSANNNVFVQAEAAHAAIIGAGTTSAQVGMAIFNSTELPFKMDGSAQGGVLNLGSNPASSGAANGKTFAASNLLVPILAAALPTCNAAANGLGVYVSDFASLPARGATITTSSGTGTATVGDNVTCNGPSSAWIAQ